MRRFGKLQPATKDFNNKWAEFWYKDIGCNVIPADTQNKKTYVKWSQWQTQPLPQEQLNEWMATNAFENGMAVIVGKLWRGPNAGKYLIFLDLDNKKAIEEFSSYGGGSSGKPYTIEELSRDFIIEQHRDNPNKMHVYFYSEIYWPKKSSDVVESRMAEKGVDRIPLIEIKGRGSHGIAYCTPSKHKDGERYEIIGRPDAIVLDKKKSEQFMKKMDMIFRKYGLSYLEDVDEDGNSSLPPIDELLDTDFVVYEGQNRHVQLLRFMEHKLRKNRGYMKSSEIKELAEEWNRKHCKPPLPPREFERQWKDATKFIVQKIEEEGIDESITDKTSEEYERAKSNRKKIESELIEQFHKPDHELNVIPISQLGMDYGDKPVCVSGTVVGLSELIPDWSMVKFICKACGRVNPPDKFDERKPPRACLLCSADKTGFMSEIDYNKEPKLNQQTILLQDGSESLSCVFVGTQDQMWPVKPGQKVHALGSQRYESFYNSKSHTQDWKKYFKLLAIKPLNGLDVKLEEKDEEYFRELASLPKYDFIEDILVPSFAPHVRGNMTDCKKVCVFALGSQGLERPFNVVLLGPPAKGKTECTRTTAELSHNGNLTEFIHTSIAGLTSETVQDPMTNARIAKPGILATYSVACFTDMNAAVQHPEGKKLLLSMNHALENKVVTSGKAGGSKNFPARCVVVIDSNNHQATWYYDEPVSSNMQFAPRSFMSRVDFGAIVPKDSTREQNEEIADINYESYAENENALKLHEGDWTDPKTGAPRLGFESLRKFFFYIAQQPLPPMPKEDQELKKYFRDNYIYVLNNNPENLVDGRYNRTIMILARVIARLLMKKIADKKDLDQAIDFVNKFKRIETLIPRTGKYDANFQVYADSKEQVERSKLGKLQQWANACEIAMQNSEDGLFTKYELSEILTKMEGTGWHNKDMIFTKVEEFSQHGMMMQPKPNRFKWIGENR